MSIDLDQITVNVNDIIPPDNFATVDAGAKNGTVYTKEQDNDWRKEVEERIQQGMILGIKGVATSTNAPTPWVSGSPYLYERWRVLAPATLTNFKDSSNTAIITTTSDFANDVNGHATNDVFIDVINGVSKKEVVRIQGEKGDTNPVINVIDATNVVDAVTGKAVVDTLTDVFPFDEKLINKNTPVSPATNYNTSVGFRGHGSPIGAIKNFNRLRVNIPTQAVLPTFVTVVIRLNSKDGAILYSTTINPTLVASADNFIALDFPTIKNDAGDNLYLQIFSDADIKAYGKVTTDLNYSPSSWRNSSGNWNNDVTQKNIYFQAILVTQVPKVNNGFYDKFKEQSAEFSELDALKEEVVIVKEFIDSQSSSETFKPSPGETEGGAMNNPYAVGLLIQDTNVSFNEVDLYISGIADNQNLILNIFPFDSIPTGSNIIMPTSLYSQEFTGGDIAMANKSVIKLTDKISANGKYLMIVFTNKLSGYRVQTLRKSGAGSSGVFALSYLSTNAVNTITSPFAKNSDSIRFDSPVLRMNNIPNKDLVSSLEGENSLISKNNGKISFKAVTDSSNTSYFGVEFKINENVNINNGEKEILKFSNGDNYLKLYITTAESSPMELVQYSLNGATVPSDRPQWAIASKYPLPYYNAQVKLEVKVAGVINTYNFPKRNFRDWKPIVGKDAFAIQFKPQLIKDGGLIVDNQSLYQANKDWYITVGDSSLIVSNTVLSKTKTYSFVDYPTVAKLVEALQSDATSGGFLEDFQVDMINTGTISSIENPIKLSRPSTDLLKCSLKLVDIYPYFGYKANTDRTIYDAWRAFIPYAVDDSWHTFEFITRGNSIDLFFMLDGKPSITTGYLKNGRKALENGNVVLGGGINCAFKNLEYYAGHTNGYEAYMRTTEEAKMFIASKKNPRLLGIMWHDIMDSSVVGRPTVWMDVPKNIRESFDTQVAATHSGASIILYRKYGDFKAEPVLISGNRYSVTCRTGEVLAGPATIVSGMVEEIKVDQLISGVWSTASPSLKLYQGKVNRVGNDVLITTAFLEQCFQQCVEKGYKIITYQEMLDVLSGNRNDSLKYLVPQFDDWPLYMYTNNNIRKLFHKFGAKISIALELNNVANSDGSAKEPQKTIALEMQRNGHESVLHQHYNSNRLLEFIAGIASDEAERGIIECIYKSGESGVTMHIHDQSANQSTPNSMKLFEFLGFELSISTQNQSTTRATPRMYASRGGLYPRYATYGSTIE
ncbi:hypothetical protein [Chryseobacterium balustinum]|uniref:hypothetical protein n=1 Tax=Chryseobacterium balustinum TaxID=246 RepID=UPI003CEFFD26